MNTSNDIESVRITTYSTCPHCHKQVSHKDIATANRWRRLHAKTHKGIKVIMSKIDTESPPSIHEMKHRGGGFYTGGNKQW